MIDATNEDVDGSVKLFSILKDLNNFYLDEVMESSYLQSSKVPILILVNKIVRIKLKQFKLFKGFKRSRFYFHAVIV